MGETRETAYIPKNIRQVGAPDFAKKIYVEDYVITYINGIFTGSDEQEKVLLLFGGEALSGPCHYIYVRGAFEVKTSETEEKYFTAEDLKKAMEEAKKYFKDLPLIGWALIRQGQPMTFEEKMQTTWEAYMSRIPLFFLGDLLEKEEIFYWKYDGNVKAQPGYFIFYEKNRAMQEYMIEVREKVKWQPEPQETNRVVEDFRSRLEENQKNYEKTKSNVLSVAVSIFLMVVVLAIGMTLLNHYEKMDEIQASVESLLSTLSERELKESQNVASKNIEVTETTESVSVSETTTVRQITTSTQQVTEQTTTAAQAATQAREAAVQPEVTVTPRTHTIEKGETLLSISLSIYGNANMMDDICKLNNISNPNSIYEGQEIQLP